jgi:hypothetical protein
LYRFSSFSPPSASPYTNASAAIPANTTIQYLQTHHPTKHWDSLKSDLLTSSTDNDMSRVVPVNRSSRSSRSKLSSQNWVPAWPNPINQQKIPSETLPCKSIFEDTSHKVLLVQSCRNITMWVDFCG